MKAEAPQWQEPEAKKYLDERGGSKAGTYAFLFDKHPELRAHLPADTHYLAPGENPESILSKMDTNVPKVVRGCHPLDVAGMVDVIPTQINVRGEEAIRKAIEEVLQAGRADDVRGFVEYESGQTFDGKIGVLVQNHNKGNRGSIVEHPHERGVYRVTVANKLANDELYDAVCVKDGREMNVNRSGLKKREKKISDEKWPLAKEVIAFYRKILDTGLMPSTHSAHMEFGMTPRGPLFYQARLFRPFEKAAKFGIEDIVDELDIDTQYSKTRPYDAYGITPAEGWEMPLAELDEDFIAPYAGHEEMAYAYNNYGWRDCTSLNAHPRNVQAYLPYQYTNVMEHGHYRWIQKAPVALVGSRRGLSAANSNFYAKLQRLDEKIRIRVYSNGIQGLAVVVK